jgi:hypothetical protein
MRETNARGNTEIYMPKDRQTAAHKLGELSAVASSREWERAALIALLVKSAGRGRPKKTTNVRDNSTQQYTITEFTKIGIYGFRSQDSVRASLKAWSLSGLPVPVFGTKTELPTVEYPEVSALYTVGHDSATEIELSDEPDEAEYGETADDTGDTASPSPRPRSRPQPESTMLDQFLKVLDHADPNAILHGQTPDKISLLIKTLDSWLESLKEAAAAGTPREWVKV